MAQRPLFSAYRALVSLAYLWAIFNAVYVYLALQGQRVFRIESSLWIALALTVPLLFWREPERAVEPSIELPRIQSAAIVGLACAGWLCVMLPRLTLPFLSDDYVFLGIYRTPADVWVSLEFFRPLFAAVFTLVSAVGQQSVVPFHVLALVLHLGSAALVSVMTQRLLQNGTMAAIAFALFLVNPLQLEATLWVSGIQELVWTFAILVGLFVYTRSRTLTGPMLAGSLVAIAAALLSKETAIAFLLMFPAMDGVLYRFERGPMRWRAYSAFVALAIAYAAVRSQFTVLELRVIEAPSRYFLKQLFTVSYATFSQPWNAAEIHPPAIVPATIATTIIALVWLRVVVKRMSPRILIGPGVILVSTLPVYTFFSVGPDLVAARYLYFAAAGWALLAAQLLTVIRHRSLVAALFAAVVAASLVCLRINAAPWDVATNVIAELREGLGKGESPSAITTRLAATYGSDLKAIDGVPESYRGVIIFRNGFPEFRRLATRGATAETR